MRIAVTGFLGNLGWPLYQRLNAEGHTVIGVDNRHAAEGLRADVAHYRQISALPEVDLVYHFAGEFGRFNGRDFTEQLWATNVTGTRNLLRLQEERGFKMIFASSSEVYGERGTTLLTEDLPPVYLPNDYAISKQVNEQQIANAGGENMVIRICNVYGCEHYTRYRSVIGQFLHHALRDEGYTVHPYYRRTFLYIDDFVDTLAGCTEHFHAGETINVAGGSDPIRIWLLHEMISELLGLDPYRPDIEVVGLDPKNVVEKRMSTEKAERLLGHRPRVGLADGLKKTIQWMRR